MSETTLANSDQGGDAQAAADAQAQAQAAAQAQAQAQAAKAPVAPAGDAVASNVDLVESQADKDAREARDARVDEMAKAYEDADDPEAAARIRERYTDETTEST